MNIHHAAPGGDPAVQKRLHHRSLIGRCGKPHAVTLPIAVRPVAFDRRFEPRNAGKLIGILGSEPPAPIHDLGKSPQLLAADRRLKIGHAIIVAQLGVGLINHFPRAVPDRVADAHPMLAPKLEFAVVVCIGGGQHAAVAGRDHLAGVKGETRDVADRLANLLPPTFPQDLASRSACGIFDHRNGMASCYLHDGQQVAGHAKLVHAQYCLGTRRDG